MKSCESQKTHKMVWEYSSNFPLDDHEHDYAKEGAWSVTASDVIRGYQIKMELFDECHVAITYNTPIYYNEAHRVVDRLFRRLMENAAEKLPFFHMHLNGNAFEHFRQHMAKDGFSHGEWKPDAAYPSHARAFKVARQYVYIPDSASHRSFFYQPVYMELGTDHAYLLFEPVCGLAGFEFDFTGLPWVDQDPYEVNEMEWSVSASNPDKKTEFAVWLFDGCNVGMSGSLGEEDATTSIFEFLMEKQTERVPSAFHVTVDGEDFTTFIDKLKRCGGEPFQMKASRYNYGETDRDNVKKVYGVVVSQHWLPTVKTADSKELAYVPVYVEFIDESVFVIFEPLSLVEKDLPFYPLMGIDLDLHAPTINRTTGSIKRKLTAFRNESKLGEVEFTGSRTNELTFCIYVESGFRGAKLGETMFGELVNHVYPRYNQDKRRGPNALIAIWCMNRMHTNHDMFINGITNRTDLAFLKHIGYIDRGLAVADPSNAGTIERIFDSAAATFTGRLCSKYFGFVPWSIRTVYDPPGVIDHYVVDFMSHGDISDLLTAFKAPYDARAALANLTG